MSIEYFSMGIAQLDKSQNALRKMKTEAESRINKENDDNTAEKYDASRGPNEVN